MADQDTFMGFTQIIDTITPGIVSAPRLIATNESQEAVEAVVNDRYEALKEEDSIHIVRLWVLQILGTSMSVYKREWHPGRP